VIPMVCDLRIHRRDGRHHHLWIPLFLLWPFIVVLFTVAQLLVMIACVVLLLIWPRDVVRIALVLPSILYLLSQTTGLKMEIAGPGQSDVLVELL